MMQARCIRDLLAIVLIFCASDWAHLAANDQPEAEFQLFEERILPILQRRCLKCHSHAAGAIEGNLALDWKSGWEAGGARGPAIVPGDPDRSLLIQAVRHAHDDLRMPETRLTEDEIDQLETWVRRGAADPRRIAPNDSLTIDNNWWSLRPLQRPPIPRADTESTSQNPIDAFVIARLSHEGLQPSPSADRLTLIRRLSVNLIGILPDIDLVDRFLSDSSPNATETVVDQLLASPGYGENWARHWMDTIHFADSHGFEHDVFRPHAWPFRDYLIYSFNADKPWQEMIHEQLAADAFHPDDSTRMPALGFLGAGTYDHSAAITAPKSFENLDRDDLVSQTMEAFVSTTAGCARCHAHKFDPISQDEYYALQAVFAGIGKGNIAYDTDPQVKQQRLRWSQLIDACRLMQTETLLQTENQQLVHQWEQAGHGARVWQPLPLDSFTSVEGATLTQLEDCSILASGHLPEKETTIVASTSNLDKITAVRLDLINHDDLPQRGPGRAANGNMHLSEFQLWLTSTDSAEPQRLKIARATADFDQDGWTVQHAIDDNPATAWGIHPQQGKPHFAVFELDQPITIQSGSTVQVKLLQVHGQAHVIGRFLLSVTSADHPLEALAFSLPTLDILRLPAEQRTSELQAELSAAVLKPIAEAALSRLPAQQKLYAAGTVTENERGVIRIAVPREIRILRRGDVDQPGAAVQPGALAAISALPAQFELQPDQTESARRQALAQWLSSPDNQLTWRSIANRVWHYHFGVGLCDTPSDFGRMGGVPSHPELLDWLACELRDQGGSLKHLHRLICNSQTWQQSSDCRDDLAAKDPDNRLLGRMNRQRLQADSWRDSVLRASGQLDLAMGGPAIEHFSSRPGAQLTPILDYNQFDWESSQAGRRTIYRVVWRGIADPLLEQLDFPDLGMMAPVRGFSASPLQALTMMNNRFVLHQAGLMAQRLQSDRTDFQQSVVKAVRTVWQRHPDQHELATLSKLADQHGLAAVCRVLLNSNEFLFVD